MSDVPRHDQVIVGAGFAGLGMAIRLEQEGKRDYVVLERADDVGGTWRDNTYPGCACDVPSHLYSFSFAPNPDWTRTYSPQPEIRDYLRDCADALRRAAADPLRPEVDRRRLGQDGGHWRLETSRGPSRRDVLVAATGPLTEPALPDLPGLDDFAGTVFHSARWDHDHDLAGKRVGGRSAPAPRRSSSCRRSSPRSGSYVFQRTPPWIIPHRDRPITRVERAPVPRAARHCSGSCAADLRAREALRARLPETRRSMRSPSAIAKRHLARRSPTPSCAQAHARLRDRLQAHPALERLLPALQQPNVELVTDAASRGPRRTRRHRRRREREVDTIIFGTGFHVTDMPIADIVRGRDGRTLAEAGRQRRRRYRGTTVAGFPNLFMLIGPNTGLGHTSIVLHDRVPDRATCSDALRAMRRARRAAASRCAPEAQAAYNAERADAHARHGLDRRRLPSWYLDDKGRDTVQWPGGTRRYRRLMEHFDEAGYEMALQPA